MKSPRRAEAMTQISMALQAVLMYVQHGCVYSFKLQINCKLKRTLGPSFPSVV